MCNGLSPQNFLGCSVTHQRKSQQSTLNKDDLHLPTEDITTRGCSSTSRNVKQTLPFSIATGFRRFRSVPIVLGKFSASPRI